MANNSMAFPKLITVLLVALFALSRIHLSSCSQVMGSVSCTDCETDYDFSGIKVLVRCDKVNNISEAITEKTGQFKTTLPLNDAPTTTSRGTTSTNCWAKLGGGPTGLYVSKRNIVSKIHMSQPDKNAHTLLTPLVFSKSCHGECASRDVNIGSSMASLSWSFNTSNSGDITISIP